MTIDRASVARWNSDLPGIRISFGRPPQTLVAASREARGSFAIPPHLQGRRRDGSRELDALDAPPLRRRGARRYCARGSRAGSASARQALTSARCAGAGGRA